MPKFITVSELYEVSFDEFATDLGPMGWFRDHHAAEEAGRRLGHGVWRIRDNVPAVEMDDGKVYVLREAEPIRFGLVDERASLGVRLRLGTMNRYFGWLKRVRELLDKASGPDDADDFLKMANYVSWFGCFDDGMTPEQAVAEFKRKGMDS